MVVDGRTLSRELELYECIQCGRCTGGCPVSIRSTLNPRRLIYEALTGVQFVPLEIKEIWECSTCRTCVDRCPKKIRPVDLIIALRSQIVEGGRVTPSVRDAMESTYLHGNPWGRAREKRVEWMETPALPLLSEKSEADTLFFVCCTAAYDPRIQSIPRSLMDIFQAAAADIAILGVEESCCAAEMKELGEEGLFEMCRDSNSETFSKYRFRTLLTASPHCFHTFLHHYPNENFEVEHYTQSLARWIEEGKLKLSKELGKKITYHDPCFLGKRNGIFEEPRFILSHLPGSEFMDMERSRERSLCCEGGGGRMWMESEASGERLAEIRIKDAIALGAEILATACPFCLLTLEDAVKTSGNEGKIEVKDISELVRGAL